MRCHRKSNQVMSPEVAGCLRSTLAAVPFKVVWFHEKWTPQHLFMGQYYNLQRMPLLLYLFLKWAMTYHLSWVSFVHCPPPGRQLFCTLRELNGWGVCHYCNEGTVPTSDRCSLLLLLLPHVLQNQGPGCPFAVHSRLFRNRTDVRTRQACL